MREVGSPAGMYGVIIWVNPLMYWFLIDPFQRVVVRTKVYEPLPIVSVVREFWFFSRQGPRVLAFFRQGPNNEFLVVSTNKFGRYLPTDLGGTY